MSELHLTLEATDIQSMLEAFSAGDALGMPTEFMTRSSIKGRFGLVDSFIAPSESQNHPNLRRAEITDDTEQNICLMSAYARRGRINTTETATTLLTWVRESGAVEKNYIGPSSLEALKAIEKGCDP